MKKRKLSAAPRNASIVQLNVGGKAFHTTADTLSLCGYFKPVLDGRLQHGKDDHGRMFIDRSPELFAILLQFLRTCHVLFKNKDMYMSLFHMSLFVEETATRGSDTSL